jgi:hypothetical protein
VGDAAHQHDGHEDRFRGQVRGRLQRPPDLEETPQCKDARHHTELRGKDGPLVFDAPPGLQGILLDFWQRPIAGPTLRGQSYLGDVGFFGPDQGKGGKFLLLPPGYNGSILDGYYVFRSQTNNVFIFLRGFYQDPADLSPGVNTLEGARIYPLGREKDTRAMSYPDASGVPVNLLPRKDASAFEQLKQLVDTEPASLADPDWMGMFAAIGIEKGKPFKPDARTRRILDAAAASAYQMSRVLGTRSEINGVNYKVYPDRQWINPMASGNPFDMAWHRAGGKGEKLVGHCSGPWLFRHHPALQPD